MIIGVGIDLIEVDRVRRFVERWESSLTRIFTPAEVERCRAGGRLAESLAARFAAKEAFFKALGTGWGRGGSWTEVEVVSAPNGAPSLRLSGTAERRAEERGVARLHLSLTHTEGHAGAFVVLES